MTKNKLQMILLWTIWMTVYAAGCVPSESVLQQTEDVSEETQDEDPDTEEIGGGETKTEVHEKIFVEVCGAVRYPGVYEMEAESRVFHGIEMAGGLTEEGSLEGINQAEVLTDGQQIRIYTVEEVQRHKEEMTMKAQNAGADGKIDLNHADKELLMTLTGIGETRADAILAYRENQGGFSTIEELMQVEGIKEKTYEKLKEQITVS